MNRRNDDMSPEEELLSNQYSSSNKKKRDSFNSLENSMNDEGAPYQDEENADNSLRTPSVKYNMREFKYELEDNDENPYAGREISSEDRVYSKSKQFARSSEKNSEKFLSSSKKGSEAKSSQFGYSSEKRSLKYNNYMKKEIEQNQLEREMQLNKKYFEKAEKSFEEREQFRQGLEEDIEEVDDEELYSENRRIPDEKNLENKKETEKRAKLYGRDPTAVENQERPLKNHGNDYLKKDDKHTGFKSENMTDDYREIGEKIRKMKEELRQGSFDGGEVLGRKIDRKEKDRPKEIKREILASGSKGFASAGGGITSTNIDKLTEKEESDILNRKYDESSKRRLDFNHGESDYRRYLKEKLEREEKERESQAKDRVIKDLRSENDSLKDTVKQLKQRIRELELQSYEREDKKRAILDNFREQKEMNRPEKVEKEKKAPVIRKENRAAEIASERVKELSERGVSKLGKTQAGVNKTEGDERHRSKLRSDMENISLEKEMALLETIDRIKSKLRKSLKKKLDDKKEKIKEEPNDTKRKKSSTKRSATTSSTAVNSKFQKDPLNRKHKENKNCENCIYLLRRGIPTSFCSCTDKITPSLRAPEKAIPSGKRK